jgi:hypothetical protein
VSGRTTHGGVCRETVDATATLRCYHDRRCYPPYLFILRAILFYPETLGHFSRWVFPELAYTVSCLRVDFSTYVFTATPHRLLSLVKGTPVSPPKCWGSKFLLTTTMSVHISVLHPSTPTIQSPPPPLVRLRSLPTSLPSEQIRVVTGCLYLRKREPARIQRGRERTD